MKVIGITGGTGSGKTTAMRALERLGCYAIDADEVYHRMLSEDTQMKEELREAFPEAFRSGNFDRHVMGHMAYTDMALMEKLNAITHKYVIAEVEHLLDTGRKHNARIAIIDAVLLIESGLDAMCDMVVGIVAPVETRLMRIVERDGISEEHAMLRIKAQPDEAFYREHCDYIVESGEKQNVHTAESIISFYDGIASGRIKIERGNRQRPEENN
ncbi:dephospho-CoA kinase [Oscillospiraceae bacterium OttesenSCG-928-F05]|nr:dephospho-CoA kinase [Oscillospiraceae bacterium OttesenSCG-928-F05]